MVDKPIKIEGGMTSFLARSEVTGCLALELARAFNLDGTFCRMDGCPFELILLHFLGDFRDVN